MTSQPSRVIPVTLLLLLAMAGLRGAIAGPHWTGPLRGDGLAVGLAFEAVLAVLLVITIRRGPATGEDVGGKLRLLLRFVLGAGMAAISVALLVYVHLRLPAESPRARPAPARSLGFASARPEVTGGFRLPPAVLYGLLVAVLVAATAVSIWWMARRLRALAPARPAEPAPDAGRLRDAIAEGIAALREIDDARAAIIACYLAMERSLADRGAARAAADTPDELLTRATTAGLVRGTAARRLVALFYEARFSSHPLGGQQRDAAEQALAELAADLSSAPVPATDGADGMGPVAT
jgi:Domain of unknown function (DUF4129)